MRTAHYPTIRASIATRCQQWLGKGPKVNKFEQVSSLGHEMSLAGRGALYKEDGGALYRGWEGCPCMVRSNASWVMVTWDVLPFWTE